jgi:hypothetical protein
MSEDNVLVIRASEWARGRSEPTAMLTDAGRYCCLGLDARRCGVPDDAMRGRLSPIGLPHCHRPTGYAARWIAGTRNSADSAGAIDLNDTMGLTDEERIHALRPIFAKHGITIDWRPNE